MERQIFSGFLILVVLLSASYLINSCTDRQARLRDEQILALLRERVACPAPVPVTACPAVVPCVCPDAGVAKSIAEEREERPRKPLRYRMGLVIRLVENIWVESTQERDDLRWGENCVAQEGGTLTVIGGATLWRVRYKAPKYAESGGTLCPDGIEARVDPTDLEAPR